MKAVQLLLQQAITFFASTIVHLTPMTSTQKQLRSM
jgi:hypothetical protein